MKIDERDDRQLDEMLRRIYEPLARGIAEQRLAVLSGFAQARAKTGANPVRRHIWRSRVAWLAAASILVAIGLKMLLIPSSSASVYALETAGRRLCEVKTIRVRGARYARHGAKPDSPPIRVPIEHLIKRPDKFSHTWWSISHNGDVVKVGGGTRVCDGRHQTTTRDTKKQYTTTQINPIDARLTTETFAQWILRFAVLGRPEARYNKIGRETTGGRDCDVYEARLEDEADGSVMVEKLWFDPASGYPVRKIVDRILPDGKIEHDSDYSEISVNVALADELFSTVAPAGYERLGDAPEETATDVPLSMASTGSCSGGFDQTLAAWHTFRITDNAALVIWRRSVPKPAADGSLDWLSQMEMTVSEPKCAVRHTWLYQSRSPEIWNWSLVADVDRQLPDPGIFEFKLVAERFVGTLGLYALRFPDDQLDQILKAAGAAALPEGAPRHSLTALRAKALELSKQ
jgi:outer membrane lipoprotein-sorting protein